MEENYLLALLVSLLFGFVLFKKDETDPEESKEKKKTLATTSSSVSSVERYLKNQEDTTNSNDGLSRVSKYIQERESLNIDKEKSIAVSNVEKYLAIKEKDSPVSSVSKYLAKKTIHEKK